MAVADTPTELRQGRESTVNMAATSSGAEAVVGAVALVLLSSDGLSAVAPVTANFGS